MERRGIAIQGTVQGVGFRPFVFGLASRLKLGGFVKNLTGGVRIEVEGEPVVVCSDAAVCDACLAELYDPRDRRYRHPFLNCTNCGPRLTIVTGAPCDRQRTTMAGFAMCAACRAEYEDPANRRFHAQPVACPQCGPRLELLDSQGRHMEGDDPLARFAESVREGRIGALKGLGGYHLVCDATRAAVVAELRHRKHRDERPFAIMVGDAAAARALCAISPAEEELLLSVRRPIVLLRKAAGHNVAEEVAPRNRWLGVMLPYTPLHHLLMAEVDGLALVMTSGNRSDEPICCEDAEAVERLGGIADVFLTHNRPIHVRCDDSVTRMIDGAESPVRRSRGYAPHPLRLPLACPAPILAVGGQQKVAFALGCDHQATLSQHMGDLDHFDAYRAFEEDIALYERLFAIKPRWIAHDLHLDYASTRYALNRGQEEGLACLAVQHHHAHMASCMAEHGLAGPVIGVTFDGTGFGADGALWGGEFLIGDYRRFQRAAHLRYVGMPGGERAIREPWRMALAHLVDAGCSRESLAKRVLAAALRTAEKMLQRRFNTPLTSSAGRLFDAIAALAGVRDMCSYEGQAAVELERAATLDTPGGEAAARWAGRAASPGVSRATGLPREETSTATTTPSRSSRSTASRHTNRRCASAGRFSGGPRSRTTARRSARRARHRPRWGRPWSHRRARVRPITFTASTWRPGAGGAQRQTVRDRHGRRPRRLRGRSRLEKDDVRGHASKGDLIHVIRGEEDVL